MPVPVEEKSILDSASFIGVVRVINVEKIVYEGDWNEAAVKAAIGPSLKLIVQPVETYRGQIGENELVYFTQACDPFVPEKDKTGEVIIVKNADGKLYLSGSDTPANLKHETWARLRSQARK